MREDSGDAERPVADADIDGTGYPLVARRREIPMTDRHRCDQCRADMAGGERDDHPRGTEPDFRRGQYERQESDHGQDRVLPRPECASEDDIDRVRLEVVEVRALRPEQARCLLAADTRDDPGRHEDDPCVDEGRGRAADEAAHKWLGASPEMRESEADRPLPRCRE